MPVMTGMVTASGPMLHMYCAHVEGCQSHVVSMSCERRRRLQAAQRGSQSSPARHFQSRAQSSTCVSIGKLQLL